MTYKEICFMVLDQLKISSDDSYFDVPHVIWLVNKYRALLLKRSYDELKKDIPEHVYQTLCLDLETTDDCVKGVEVRSVQHIPRLINVGALHISPVGDFFQTSEWTYILPERMQFVGHNKYLKKIIYFTVYNHYLYVKGFSTGYEYLKKVMFHGILEDPADALKSEYRCDNGDGCKDILDMKVPIEESMVPALMEMVLKDLTPSVYKPEDKTNDAKDDLSEVSVKS